MLVKPAMWPYDKTALDNLQGSWTAVNARRLDLHRMIFKGDKIILVFSESLKKEYLVTVNVKPKPAHIDVLHNKEKSLGIYELDRDTLRICMGPWLGPRPTDFKSKGKNVVLVTLMREEKCNLSDALLAAGVPRDNLTLKAALRFVHRSPIPAHANPRWPEEQGSGGGFAYCIAQQKSKPPQPAALEVKLLKALAECKRGAIERVAADILLLSDEQRRDLRFRLRPGAVEFRFAGRCPGHEDVEFLLSNQNRGYESLLVVGKAELERAEKVWKAAKLARATLPPFLELKLLWMDKDEIRCEDLQDAFRKTDPNQRTKQYFRRLSWEDDGLRIPNIPLDPAAVPRADQTAQMLIILRPAFLD